MAVLLFIIWLVFNGRVTGEIAVFGFFLAAGLYLFLWKYLDYSPRFDWILLRSIPLAMLYLLVLIREIVLATLAMAGFIFNRRDLPEAALVSFHPALKTPLACTVLANSITMTPGTITVEMREGDFRVHCYDRSMAFGLDTSDGSVSASPVFLSESKQKRFDSGGKNNAPDWCNWQHA